MLFLYRVLVRYSHGLHNSWFTEYDPFAIIDDGSRRQSYLGCTDADAINFNPDANTLGESNCMRTDYYRWCRCGGSVAG